MTQYVSDHDLQVVANGVTARFKAGVPRPLRPSLVNPAIGMGVQPVDGDVEAKSQPKASEPAPEQDAHEPNIGMVVEALKTIKARGNTEDVTANGEVRMNVLSAEVGYDVSTDDREAAKQLIEG